MTRSSVRAIVLAAVAAGVISTLVQVALWIVFTDAFPAILYRDARLAAAIVSGPSILERAEALDFRIMAIATVVHFAVSIAFAAMLSVLVARCSMRWALVRGTVFGIAMYVLNLHVMTYVFPWFAASRGAITLAAHVAFGASAAIVYRYARARSELPQSRASGS